MKKCLALLLVLSMAFSLFAVPASAEETNPVIWQDKIDQIPDNTNIFYESASSSKPTSKQYDANGGILVSLQCANYNITTNSKRIGTFDNSTKTITGLSNFFGYSGATDTLQDRYAENQQLIVGTALGTTYTSDSTTTGTYIAGQPFKGASLTKVQDPENAENYVLRYDFGQTGSNKASLGMNGGVYTRLNAGTETAITTADGTNHTAIGKMVYEWKVRVPAATIPLFQHSAATNHISLGGIMANNGYSRLLRDTVYTNVKSDGTYELRVEYKVSDAKTGTINSFPHVVLSADTWHSFKQVISVDETAISTGRPIVEVYFDGEKVGTYRTADENSKFVMKGSTAAGWTTGQWCAGIGPDATGDSAIDANNMIVYFDDINQYWLSDTLTVSGVADSYTEFTAKDTVEVTYSQAADFEALENAISVTKNGEAANVTVTVTPKDEYTALISFSGLDMTDENTYNVTISEFADIFGNKNTTPKIFTVTTKAAGKMKVTPSVSYIYGYEAGTSRIFTITTEYEADLSNVEFFLKNENNDVIAELIPSVDDTGMVLSFDLKDANLEDMSANYTFVSEGYFTQSGGDALNSDVITIPVSVVSYNYQGAYLINDDYENETLNENWLINSSAIQEGYSIKGMHLNLQRGSYTPNSDGKTYSYQECSNCSGTTFADNFLTDSFIGVVQDPKDESNKVLKYQAGKNGDGIHGFRVAHNLGATQIDVNKNIIMSADIFLTDTIKDKLASNRYNYIPAISSRSNFEDNYLRANIQSTDTGLKLKSDSLDFETELTVGDWFELKYVVMPTTAATKSEDGTTVTYGVWKFMVYINNVLVYVDEQYEFSGYNGKNTTNGITYNGAFATTGNTGLNMYGVHMGLYPSSNGETTPTFYVDNIKLYQPEKPAGAYVFTGPSVVISYNNVLDRTSASDVVITDESGEVLENAASSISLGIDGKSVIIAFNTDVITPLSVYGVSGLTDAFGQKVGAVTFTTPKSYTVYTESGMADTSVSGKISVPVNVVNAGGNIAQAVLVVAVYDYDYEMIGASSVVFDALGSEGYNNTVDVDITGHNVSDIKSIKVHLWDSVAGMQPYQTAELVSFE